MLYLLGVFAWGQDAVSISNDALRKYGLLPLKHKPHLVKRGDVWECFGKVRRSSISVVPQYRWATCYGHTAKEAYINLMHLNWIAT